MSYKPYMLYKPWGIILYLTVFNILLFTYHPLQAQATETKNLANIAKPTSAPKKRYQESYHELFIDGLFFAGISADLVYSRLYKLPLMGGGSLGYAYVTPRMRHEFSLEGKAGRLRSPYTAASPSYPAIEDFALQFSFNYASSFLVAGSEKLNFLIGPGLDFFADIWIPDNPDVDILRYTWFIHTGAGVNLLLDWKPAEKHQLLFNLYTPILGVGWRPTYTIYTLREEDILTSEGVVNAAFSNYDFLSFHNFIKLNFSFSYRYQLTSFLFLKVGYNGVLSYLTIPRVRLDLDNQIKLGLLFQL